MMHGEDQAERLRELMGHRYSFHFDQRRKKIDQLQRLQKKSFYIDGWHAVVALILACVGFVSLVFQVVDLVME